MKKLVCMAAIAMVLTVFNGCTKEELKTPSDDGVTKTGKADVYLENDYLVVKSFEAIDSLQKTLQNKSLEEQSRWDRQLGLKSAKMYRAQASDKLAGFTNLQQAETYAKELVQDGYFSMIDSSMHYPFYNYSWDCVLNKNGVIKIGDVLYCFQKDAQISIIDGKVTTLNQFLRNPESCDTSLVKVYSFQKLKSLLPYVYGDYFSKTVYSEGGGVRFSLYFKYGPVTEVRHDVYGNDITVQVGLKYYLYFHEEKKGVFGWRDTKDIYNYKRIGYDWGGNYDPVQNAYSYRYINTLPETNYNQVNVSELANVYYTLQTWSFPAISPYSTYAYGGTAPIINYYSGSGNSNYVTLDNKKVPIDILIN